MRKKTHTTRSREKSAPIRVVEPLKPEDVNGGGMAAITPIKPMNSAEALQRVIEIVRERAEEIAIGLANAGAEGQQAPAKFLFEIAGIYPPNEKMVAEKEPEECVTYSFLKKHGFVNESEFEPTKEDGTRAVK